MIILNVIILLLLILYIYRKKDFFIDCNENGIKMNPENSYKSFLKGWCTTSNFNDTNYFDSLNTNEVNNHKCLNGLKPLSGYESSLTNSKSFCSNK